MDSLGLGNARIRQVLAIALLLAAIMVRPASARIEVYRGTLTGADFPIDTKSPATGEVVAYFDTVARTLLVEWSVEGLVGVPTVPGMHLHNAPRYEIGNILFVAYSTAWPTEGSAFWEGMTDFDVRQLRKGLLYLNMHTSRSPTDGEVRAQLERVICQPDVNRDSVLDNADVLAFVELFIAQDPAADFNADGLTDNGDIFAFVTLFLEGCDDSLPIEMPWEAPTPSLQTLRGERPWCDCGCEESLRLKKARLEKEQLENERAGA